VTEIQRRCSNLKNSRLSDIQELFTRELKMDLNEDDIEARILNYFVLFEKIVEDHDLISLLGTSNMNKAAKKGRCKLLLDNISPEILKKDVNCMVELERRDAKQDDVELYTLILERARQQQHY